MNQSSFQSIIEQNAQSISLIRAAAWKLHESVCQSYDGSLPYGYHLSMVADAPMRWGHTVVTSHSDVLPVIFAAFFHDSIEDARLSYNDLLRLAGSYLNEEQALAATEIVYALTNDKGRTRAERAGERYYAGIRTTPYAPFVKLCDRYANTLHSHSDSTGKHPHMLRVYRSEWPHFIEAINAHSSDSRFSLPQEMIAEIESIMQ